MRSCVVLLFASLLTLCEAQGTIDTSVFVLKGRDLLLKLDADPPKGFTSVVWKINKTVDLVSFDPSGEATVLHNVTGGFAFGENKFSVILKNVQEVDSSVYSAVAVTDGIKLLTEYQVTVEGPVSPVGLTVDRVDPSSSESCDVHVTCRTPNSDISSTFRCSKRVCSQEGGERLEVTTSGASLQVYMLHNVIICNHRNQVNWTQGLIHAEHLCPKHADPLRVWVMTSCTLVAILAVVLLIVVVLIVWLYKNRKKRIGFILKQADQGSDTDLNPISAPLKNSSPADPSGPSYSSVPSAAEPTDL